MDSSVSYLVRTQDADSSRLELFTYDPKFDITAQAELIAYLTSLIEVNRYAVGPAITGVWQWNGDDTRDEMHLTLIEIRPETDNRQDEVWTITPVTGDGDGVMFTVCIDMKGQQ